MIAAIDLPLTRSWRGYVSALLEARLLCVASLLIAVTAQAQHAAPAQPPALVDRVLERIDRSLLHRCLTPEAGRAMSDLVAAGALAPVLGSDLTLARGDVRGDQIELVFHDQAQHSYSITLALPGAKTGQPSGKGARFLFYVDPSPDMNPRVVDTMLAAAALFDGAIPETALQRCAGADAPQADPRYPRAIALGSAVAEVLIVLFAIVFGLRAIRAGLT